MRAWLSMAVVLGLATGCSDRPNTPTSPTVAIGVIGKVTGLVRGEVPPISRVSGPTRVLSNATVTVIGGVASGTKTTTGQDGTYELVAAGTFRLRFEHPSFLTSESSETTVAMADGAITIPDVILVTAPWTISGRVLDSRGNGVADAEVNAGYTILGFFIPDYGTARTDAAGRYVINSTRPRFESIGVHARKPGFLPMDSLLSAVCCGAVADMRLIRIVSITPTAPTSLRVGESIEMPASTVVLDTGETRNIFVLPTSSAPSIVDVSPSSHWYAMRGVNPGVATLTFDLWGAVATTQVQVR